MTSQPAEVKGTNCQSHDIQILIIVEFTLITLYLAFSMCKALFCMLPMY